MCSVADVRPVIGMANALWPATVKQSETAKAAAAILP
jgi:hypothetical protein